MKYDVRRIWECPKCHGQLKTTGQTVTCLCEGCSSVDPPVQMWMHLVEEIHVPSNDESG